MDQCIWRTWNCRKKNFIIFQSFFKFLYTFYDSNTFKFFIKKVILLLFLFLIFHSLELKNVALIGIQKTNSKNEQEENNFKFKLRQDILRYNFAKPVLLDDKNDVFLFVKILIFLDFLKIFDWMFKNTSICFIRFFWWFNFKIWLVESIKESNNTR